MTNASDAPVILWFRNDLRLADHPALHAAIETGRRVLPVFVLDDGKDDAWALGSASRWWLHHSLDALRRALEERGAGLVLRRGGSVAAILQLAEQTGAREVFTAGSVEPRARRTDQAVAEDLAKSGGRLHRMRTTTLFNPDSIRTKSGGAYGVFTPFAKTCLAIGGPKQPMEAPSAIPGAALPASETLADWNLLPVKPDWAGGLRAVWTPGEAGAMDRAKTFMQHGLRGYAEGRDEPSGDRTSMLSPHLHFGEISAGQLWSLVHMQPNTKGREIFVRELLWREFCANLLWHNQGLPDAPLRREFAAMPWREDAEGLAAWQRGRTGVPIVDAGMRQLWQTGWMHNRVRMIVASFLIKHLMLPWQAGEAWFWDTLVDADLASNAGNWQWVAGCGADAAPYFRIFNPVLQGKKFDPHGAYVRHFVPELAKMDARYIHAPEDAPREELARAGVTLGRSYPYPIVNLAAGRARALAAFGQIRAAE